MRGRLGDVKIVAKDLERYCEWGIEQPLSIAGGNK